MKNIFKILVILCALILSSSCTLDIIEQGDGSSTNIPYPPDPTDSVISSTYNPPSWLIGSWEGVGTDNTAEFDNSDFAIFIAGIDGLVDFSYDLNVFLSSNPSLTANYQSSSTEFKVIVSISTGQTGYLIFNLNSNGTMNADLSDFGPLSDSYTFSK